MQCRGLNLWFSSSGSKEAAALKYSQFMHSVHIQHDPYVSYLTGSVLVRPQDLFTFHFLAVFEIEPRHSAHTYFITEPHLKPRKTSRILQFDTTVRKIVVSLLEIKG